MSEPITHQKNQPGQHNNQSNELQQKTNKLSTKLQKQLKNKPKRNTHTPPIKPANMIISNPKSIKKQKHTRKNLS